MTTNSKPKDTNPNLDTALRWASHGLRVFPCRNKKPLLPGSWKEYATRDADQIDKWWAEHPDASPAIVAEGICVLDCDLRDAINGVEAFNAIVAQARISLDNVLAVRTPSGGMHYYFRAPTGFDVGNSRGSLPDGIDVRSSGCGYLVAPGTVLPDGRRYEVFRGPELRDGVLLEELALLPESLVSILTGKHSIDRRLVDAGARNLEMSGSTPSTDDEGTPFEPTSLDLSDVCVPTSDEAEQAVRLLNAIEIELSRCPQGRRGTMLNSCAFRIGRKIAANVVNESDAISMLFRACEANGLAAKDGPRSVQIAIRRSINDGKKQPLGFYDSQSRPIQPHVPGESPWRSKLISPTENFLDSPRQVIRGLISEGQAGSLSGMWGIGKSFLAIDFAVAVAADLEIAGLRSELPGPVLYFSGEGQVNTRGRFEAACRSRGVGFGNIPLRVYNDVPDLTSPKDLEALLAEIKLVTKDFGQRPSLIVVDTLSRAVKSGPDTENRFLRVAVNATLRIRDEIGAAVLLIHHPPVTREDGGEHYKRPRGGGMLEGDLDFSLFAEAQASGDTNEKTVKLRIRKQRDLPDNYQLHFKLGEVLLGRHVRTGAPVTSCAIRYLDQSNVANKAKASAQPQGLRELRHAIEQNGRRILFPDGISRPAIKLEEARNLLQDLAAKRKYQPDTGRKWFNRLKENNCIIQDQDFVALHSDDEIFIFADLDLSGVSIPDEDPEVILN